MFEAADTAFYVENRKRAIWPKARGFEVNVPGMPMTQLALPWGGGTLPLYFERDARVRSCRQLTTFNNRAMFEQIIGMQQMYEKDIKNLPAAERAAKHQGDRRVDPARHAAARESAGAPLRRARRRPRRQPVGLVHDPQLHAVPADRRRAGGDRELPDRRPAARGRLRVRVPGRRPSRAPRPAAELRPRRSHEVPKDRETRHAHHRLLRQRGEVLPATDRLRRPRPGRRGHLLRRGARRLAPHRRGDPRQRATARARTSASSRPTARSPSSPCSACSAPKACGCRSIRAIRCRSTPTCSSRFDGELLLFHSAYAAEAERAHGRGTEPPRGDLHRRRGRRTASRSRNGPRAARRRTRSGPRARTICSRSSPPAARRASRRA